MKFKNKIRVVNGGEEVNIPENITLEFDPEDSGERAKVLAAFLTVKNIINKVNEVGLKCKKDSMGYRFIKWHIAAKRDEKAIITVQCRTCNKKGSFPYNHMKNDEKAAHAHIMKKIVEVLNNQSSKPHFVHWFID